MIDVVISLTILFLTLSSSYDLLVNTNRYRERVLESVEMTLEESETYEKSLENLFTE